MMKFKITTDMVARSSKPSGQEIGKISQSLNIPVEVTIEEFSQLMAEGYTFTPAIFKDNKRKNVNWLEQSVFALDFDNGITPDEIFDRFKKHGITPNVMYTSFSDTMQLRKFRVVLVVDKVVTDSSQRDFIQRGLMDMIGDVDIACKDAARLYFGGKKSKVLNPTPISLSTLFDSVSIATIANDSGKTRKIQKSVSKREFSNSNIRTHVFGQNETIEHFDFDKLANEVKIFSDFIEGQWLTHPQLFGLATALHWVKGGVKLMKTTMTKYNKLGKTQYTDNNFACLTYVKHMEYQPQRLDSYSPYKEDWEHLNPITAIREPRGLVEVLHPIDRISLKEAESRFQTYFHELSKTKDTNIYIVKVPTGLGKTRMLETVTATIALPTNQLKEEVYERVIVEKVMTPTLPKISNKELNERLDYLYRVGLPDVAIKLITQTVHQDKWKYSAEEIEALKSYLVNLRKAYGSSKAVITTHTRALYSEFKSDTIIFDEDPLNSVLQMKSFSIADFIKLEQTDLFSEKPEYRAVVDYLRDVQVGQVLKTPLFNLNIEQLAKDISANRHIEDDLISFINSDYFIRDANNTNKFTYIISKQFPEDKKIIIMSATCPVEIYKTLYGDRVKVIDITDVEHKGEIIQNTKRSFSRESLRLSLERIEELIDTQLPTITFAEFVSKIQNAVDTMYFGNVAGYDEMKGKSLNILGTPHLHQSTYLLIASVLGIKLKPNDLVMDYQSVEWNSFKFKFNCYSHPQLREIQLSMIENELLQAIGRARALREDCKVFVYSNLPLRISTSMKR